MKLLDVVAILEDLPENKLYRGQVGTLVEVYAPGVFKVEFSDLYGRAYALETLTQEKLMVLYHQPLQEQMMDINSFTNALIQILVNELNWWRRNFAFECMRAFDLGCHPWHGYLEASFLTTKEDFDVEEFGKWKSVGNWRLYDFPSTYVSGWPQALNLSKWMKEQYEVAPEPKAMAEKFFEACANVVTSEQVVFALKLYNLADNFEVGVFNTDEPVLKNYCDNLPIVWNGNNSDLF